MFQRGRLWWKFAPIFEGITFIPVEVDKDQELQIMSFCFSCDWKVYFLPAAYVTVLKEFFGLFWKKLQIFTMLLFFFCLVCFHFISFLIFYLFCSFIWIWKHVLSSLAIFFLPSFVQWSTTVKIVSKLRKIWEPCLLLFSFCLFVLLSVPAFFLRRKGKSLWFSHFSS